MSLSERIDEPHEESPLLHGETNARRNGPEDGERDEWNDEAKEKTKSWWYLFLLTISIGGLQIVWSVELGSGSPYLLSLGISKAILAIIWIAGPLTGVIVQPYIGMQSDNCRITWGRRKPFMIGGGIATMVSLVALAWAKEIVEFIAMMSPHRDLSAIKVGVIAFATALMWILDFAINTVQAAIRAFIVDNAPAHQQEEANAWASRVIGVGNVLGYIFGYLDLPKFFPFFGNTQFKVLCVIASFALGITLLISCLTIKEQDPNLFGPPDKNSGGVINFFQQTLKSIRQLQPQVRKVCEVQLANWIAWFPFLYYITTFIGQLYVNPYLEKNQKHPYLSDDDIDELWQEGTRVGTFSLLIYAITSFAANVILPFLIASSNTQGQTKQADSDESVDIVSTSPRLGRSRTPAVRPALAYSTSVASLSAQVPNKSAYQSTNQSLLTRLLEHLRIPGLTLRRLWIFAHILFAICMFSTFFIRTPMLAAVMTALVGISWSVTLWAPFALISAEVARNAERQRRKHRKQKTAQSEDLLPSDVSSSTSATTTTIATANAQSEDSASLLDPELAHPFPDDPNEASEQERLASQAGIILGLHNVAISAPQLVATLISSAVFRALQKPRGTPGDDSVGWVLRLSGIAALVAAGLTTRLSEEVGR